MIFAGVEIPPYVQVQTWHLQNVDETSIHLTAALNRLDELNYLAAQIGVALEPMVQRPIMRGAKVHFEQSTNATEACLSVFVAGKFSETSYADASGIRY